MNNSIPASRWSPTTKRRINQLRLYTDLMGVTMIRMFIPYVQGSVAHLALDVYNVAAWVTILMVDSTRVPEATTTRRKQKQALIYACRWMPLFLGVYLLLTFGLHQATLPNLMSAGATIGITISSYVDELLFRNTLQPKLRQWGMPIWAANAIQSSLYAGAIYIEHAPVPIVLSFWLLGVVNGWIVYRFRSLWPAFILGLIWNILWLA